MFELQDDHFNTISYGNRHHISHLLKQQVHDGRYRIVGPGMQLYCVRIHGNVYPDPEKVPLQRHTNPKGPALQYAPID